MHFKQLGTAAGMWFLFSQASWAMYKCPGPTSPIFQDAPCADGKVIDAKPAMSTTGPDGLPPTQNGHSSANSSPLSGTGKNHLIQLYGTPTRQTSSVGYDGSVTEVLTFVTDGQYIMATLKNGYVISSSSSNRNVHGNSRSTQDCPDSLTIRNAETAASSRMQSYAERREKMREVARLKSMCL